MAVEASVAIPRSQRRPFFGLAIVFLAFLAVGFGPTFFLRPFTGVTDFATGARALPPHLVLHGVALTAWFLLFAVQAWLGSTMRIQWHRRLGVAGVFVAAAVVATSVPVLAGFLPRVLAWLTATGANPDLTQEGLRRVTLTIVPASIGLLEFALYFAAAVYWRRAPATHKRLMLFASHAIVFPALSPGRLLGQLLAPVPTPLFSVVLFAIVIWYDVASTRRVHPATWWGLAGVAALFVAIPSLGMTEAGPAYVRWLTAVFHG